MERMWHQQKQNVTERQKDEDDRQMTEKRQTKWPHANQDVNIYLPETRSIFANMGVRGNSAICRPSGDVRFPLSSRAEIMAKLCGNVT